MVTVKCVLEQFPDVVTRNGESFITYFDTDKTVQLFCRCTKSGKVAVRHAEEIGNFNEETGDWDFKVIPASEGIKRFGFDKVLHPRTMKLVPLVVSKLAPVVAV